MKKIFVVSLVLDKLYKWDHNDAFNNDAIPC